MGLPWHARWVLHDCVGQAMVDVSCRTLVNVHSLVCSCQSHRLAAIHSANFVYVDCLPPRAYTFLLCFFFNDTATTEIYTLSLHDALPILPSFLPLPRGVRTA